MLLVIASLGWAAPWDWADAMRAAADSPASTAVAQASRATAWRARAEAAPANPHLAWEHQPGQEIWAIGVPLGWDAPARWRAARVAERTAMARGSQDMLAVELDAARAWFSARAALDRVALLEDVASRAVHVASHAEARARAGEASADTVVLARVDALRAQVAARDARLQADAARRRLLAVTGATEPVLAEGLADWPADVPLAAGGESAGVRAARRDVDLARAAQAVARAGRVPEVELRLGGQRAVGASGVVLGAQVKLPVLAPGRADVLAAEADVGAAEARLAEVARIDEVDALTLSAQVELAAQTVAAWRELPVEVALSQVMQRVAAGEATLADVLPARDALVGAALSAIDAREAHARAALDTWARVGRSPLGGAP